MRFGAIGVFTAILSILCVRCRSSDMFSSLGHMKSLLTVEKLTLNEVQNYIHMKKEQLENVRSFLIKAKKFTISNKMDFDIHLSHPVNQFNLISRYVKTWKKVENLLKDPKQLSLFTLYSNYKSQTEDVIGAFTAIKRLQSTYKLQASDFVHNKVPGGKALQEMPDEDIVFIGTRAFEDDDHKTSYEWFSALLERNKTVYGSYSKKVLVDYLAVSAAYYGRLSEAIELTEMLLKEDFNNKRLQINLKLYKESPEIFLNYKKKVKDDYFNSKEFLTYEGVCRKALEPIRQKNLKCFMWTNYGNPNLIVRPLKMEEVTKASSTSTNLVRFFDFVSDWEVEQIKKLALPQLNRATVHHYQTGKMVNADYRISKSAWLDRKEHEVVKTVTDRITHATNLTLSDSEVLQIANYGMGGQYEPHHDYNRPNNVNKKRG